MIRGIVAGALSIYAALAQQITFSGQVLAPAGTALSQLTVELSASGVNGSFERTPVQTDGTFAFRSMVAGSYRLRLLSLHGDVLREDFVQVHLGVPVFTIRLTGDNQPRKAAGTVSLRRLNHHPPRQAQRLWREALDAAERGDHPAAHQLLEKAVAADPEYFEALVNLGSERYRAGDAPGALRAFGAAQEIDPGAPQPALNTALVLLRTGHPAEAEIAARRGLRAAASPAGHYLLGLSLAQQGRDLREAIDHLRQAEADFPEARPARRFLERQLGPAVPPASFTSRP